MLTDDPRIIVVDANSASPLLPGVTYYGVEATHAHMCKFASASAPGFRALSTDIRQWILDAPALIAVRWEVEGLERTARMRNEIHERMSPFVSRPLTPPRDWRADVAGKDVSAVECVHRLDAQRERHLYTVAVFTVPDPVAAAAAAFDSRGPQNVAGSGGGEAGRARVAGRREPWPGADL